MRLFFSFLLLLPFLSANCWGFYGHRQINYYAVFLLPPEMLIFYKKHIDFIKEHAVDPDKRRYLVTGEGPRHYIDIDRYGAYPYDSLPRDWKKAVEKYSLDTLLQHGIVPWWIQTMLHRLTNAFRERNAASILKISAELGHYIGDAHVPLHASSNHNGQFTNQKGIHGFWESRIPELLAEKEWDFFIGKAQYIHDPLSFTWQRVLESAAAADTVLLLEKQLSLSFPADLRYGFEDRSGTIVRVYSAAYTRQYDRILNSMVERRMRASIFAVASFWFTAWVDAGQPPLKTLDNLVFSEEELKAFDSLTHQWKASKIKGRDCD